MTCFEEEVTCLLLMPAKHHQELQMSHHIIMSCSFFIRSVPYLLFVCLCGS